MTNWRFQWLYRLGLVLLLTVAFCAVWSRAQTPSATNQGAPAVTPPLAAFAVTNALTRSLAQVPWLNETRFLGEPLWKYAASIVYIVLAFYVARAVDFVVNVWLKRLAAKTETKYDDLLIELLRGPVKVVAFVIFLHIGLGVFDWPPSAQVWLSRALIVVVACSITYVVLKMVDLFLGIWRERQGSTEDRLFAEHLFPVLSKMAKTAVVIAAILLTADNLHIEIKTLLAGLSIGGLALGLAAQDTVANLFGAVAIFLDKPFRIGDRVKVEGVDGTVETIGIRSTRVRSLDGHHVTIPNKTMGNAIITNVTRRPGIRSEMNIGITYDTPVEKVRRATRILEEILGAHPKTGDLIISFNKFADSALNILVVHVWNGTDMKEQLAGMQELNLRIKERFDAEQINFAFPSQTLYLKRG
jgi:MscS family membrane protein